MVSIAQEVSLLASTQAVEKELGHKLQSVCQLKDDTDAATIAYATTETAGAAEGAAIATLKYVGALQLLFRSSREEVLLLPR